MGADRESFDGVVKEGTSSRITSTPPYYLDAQQSGAEAPHSIARAVSTRLQTVPGDSISTYVILTSDVKGSGCKSRTVPPL